MTTKRTVRCTVGQISADRVSQTIRRASWPDLAVLDVNGSENWVLVETTRQDDELRTLLWGFNGGGYCKVTPAPPPKRGIMGFFSL